jgi:hypothetical protein
MLARSDSFHRRIASIRHDCVASSYCYNINLELELEVAIDTAARALLDH